jgi:hypothetical protein
MTGGLRPRAAIEIKSPVPAFDRGPEGASCERWANYPTYFRPGRLLRQAVWGERQVHPHGHQVRPIASARRSAITPPLDDGRLPSFIASNVPNPRRMRGRRRLVDEIGFRFRRHRDGGDVGSADLRSRAPSASASLRAASCSRFMCSSREDSMRRPNIIAERASGQCLGNLTTATALMAMFKPEQTIASAHARAPSPAPKAQ